MPAPGFWNPRQPPPQAGSVTSQVKKSDPSFWYPRKYDLSSVAWGTEELWSQKDPPEEIQLTYWKKPAAEKK